MVAIHHILSVTSKFKGFERSVFSRTKSFKSCKIHDLYSLKFEHITRGAKSSSQKILKKLNFRILYLYPTCQEELMEELSAKSLLK